MVGRLLGRSGLLVSPIGFGAFKIGRNEGIKYPDPYRLPDQQAVDHLLNHLLDLGISYIDTAPAYGESEALIGRAVGHRRHEFILSTKVGEMFVDGRSTYDYSAESIERSVVRSLERLKRDVIDLLFIHSNSRDLEILEHSDAVPSLVELKERGLVSAIGFSGKTPEGAEASLAWADAIMVEYHLQDRSHDSVIEKAAQATP